MQIVPFWKRHNNNKQTVVLSESSLQFHAAMQKDDVKQKRVARKSQYVYIRVSGKKKKTLEESAFTNLKKTHKKQNMSVKIKHIRTVETRLQSSAKSCVFDSAGRHSDMS